MHHRTDPDGTTCANQDNPKKRLRPAAPRAALAAMPSFAALNPPQAHRVRVTAPLQPHRSCTVLRLHPGVGGPQRTGTARQDVVLQLISGAVRRTDVVCELADGSFVCLMAGPLRRERLSMLSWVLLDALARLPQQPPAPASCATPASGSALLRPCIGICTRPAAGQRYAVMAQHAQTAMQRAHLQKSGFAFHDSACA